MKRDSKAGASSTRRRCGAREELHRRLGELELNCERDSALYASLVEKEHPLRTMEALQTANTFVIRSATNASQV